MQQPRYGPATPTLGPPLPTLVALSLLARADPSFILPDWLLRRVLATARALHANDGPIRAAVVAYNSILAWLLLGAPHLRVYSDERVAKRLFPCFLFCLYQYI